MTQNAGSQSDMPQKTPLRWTGVLFSLASILLLVTLADYLVVRTATASWNLGLLVTVGAPVCAGILAALYVRSRGAIHMFIGSIISMPILTAYVFSGVWQFAIFAAAFSTMGAAITEIILRRQESA